MLRGFILIRIGTLQAGKRCYILLRIEMTPDKIDTSNHVSTANETRQQETHNRSRHRVSIIDSLARLLSLGHLATAIRDNETLYEKKKKKKEYFMNSYRKSC